MRLVRFTIDGYRSLLGVTVAMDRVTVVQGGNGTGKTNLYRGLGLLAAAARGTLAQDIADEGGMQSVLWAGARRKGPQRVVVSVEWDDLRYQLQLGLPQALKKDPFPLDPEVKQETIEVPAGRRWLVVAQRAGPTAMLRDDEGPAAHLRVPAMARRVDAVADPRPERVPDRGRRPSPPARLAAVPPVPHRRPVAAAAAAGGGADALARSGRA